MLFNIEKLKWDKDILLKFKIPEQILPDVKKSSGVFGSTIKIGKLPAGIPISGIWEKDRIFKPKMKKEIASKYYSEWLDAVKRTLTPT